MASEVDQALTDVEKECATLLQKIADLSNTVKLASDQGADYRRTTIETRCCDLFEQLENATEAFAGVWKRVSAGPGE